MVIRHTVLVSTTPPPPESPAGVVGRVAGEAADSDLETPTRAATVVPFPRRSGQPTSDVNAAIADHDDATDDAEDGESPDVVEHRDWAWVEEWREGQEPTPWAPGLAVAAFATLIVGIAVVVLSDGLSSNAVVAVLVNLLVAAGLIPAIWLSRELPVLRWIGLGAAVGVVGGWIVAIGMVG